METSNTGMLLFSITHNYEDSQQASPARGGPCDPTKRSFVAAKRPLWIDEA